MAKAKAKKPSADKGKGKKRSTKKSSVFLSVQPAAPLPAPIVEKPWKPAICDLRFDEGVQEVYCKPNNYPDLLNKAQQMSIVATDKGTYESLCKILKSGLACCDRVLMLTPWGNFVTIRGYFRNDEPKLYLYDGCTCNANAFRHLDLTKGTAGFLCFDGMNQLLIYVLNARYKNAKVARYFRHSLDEICCRRNEDTDMCCNKFTTPKEEAPAAPTSDQIK